MEFELGALFRLSARGVVVDVLPPDSTQAGNPKRSFNLVDDLGAWLACCALDRNAQYVALKESMGIVLFFGTGRGPLAGAPGNLYAFKGAMIVPFGGKEVRAKVLVVEITGQ